MKSLVARPKVLPPKELARLSEGMRARGEKLVLTNGCFDILHVGHVRYLCSARSLGDALAVGVNSDESVRRLKGPPRPLIPEDERAEILAALECVDFVSIFPQDTATELVRALVPAIYVKGGDYSSDPLSPSFPTEGHQVLGYGGAVEIVDYVPAHSTTEMLERVSRYQQEPEWTE